ncbi:MAG: glutathione-dependent formaldehyde dehydrogenase [Nannocystis sp.]|nr:zinc-dependent alcohol dehydrogenase [Nannocystis sp.]MBA3548152.1 glutathione-dependent formaldehyde dehydrogenase [Nannocystis sp.]
MRALRWYGKQDVRVETVPDPTILHPRDAILKVTSCAICGSDLHLYNGFIPTMKKGDILGHEFMGVVVEVGPEVKNLAAGDRVVVPFNIACGQCFFCKNQMFSLCDNTNPNAHLAEAAFGYSPSGLFGYSHLFGGYAGGQAEYVRVPFADVGGFKVPEGLSDEQALFLGDIFPTGFMAAEHASIAPGDTVAVWGCGPVGLFTIKCAYMLGAKQVVGIDRVPERLEKARVDCGATIINYEHTDVLEALKELTQGRGPDGCIDAVGMEAHGFGPEAWYDRVKQAVRLQTDRPTALREVIKACRKGGAVSIPGVYGGWVDKYPIGAAFNKGLTFKMGQTHTHRYMSALCDRIVNGEIDPSFVITHRMALDDAPRGYDIFAHKADNCIKCVLTP